MVELKQGLTVVISAPDNAYSHSCLRFLPLKDSEVPVFNY